MYLYISLIWKSNFSQLTENIRMCINYGQTFCDESLRRISVKKPLFQASYVVWQRGKSIIFTEWY